MGSRPARARLIPATTSRGATEAVQSVTVAQAEMAGPARRRHTGGGFGAQRLGSSCDDAAFPLLEALVDAQSLVGIGEQAMQRLPADQPDALQKIDEQQR